MLMSTFSNIESLNRKSAYVPCQFKLEKQVSFFKSIKSTPTCIYVHVDGNTVDKMKTNKKNPHILQCIVPLIIYPEHGTLKVFTYLDYNIHVDKNNDLYFSESKMLYT